MSSRRRTRHRHVRTRTDSLRGSGRRQRKRGAGRGKVHRMRRIMKRSVLKVGAANRMQRSLRHAAPAALPAPRTVAAVVTVQAHDRQLPGVLRELERLAPDELIVVLDSCAGDQLEAAMQHPSALIIHIAEPKGGDACRAAGAGMTDADIVLFLEAGRPIAAERLQPFVEAVRRGADAALADNERQLGPFSRWDDAARLQAFLNRGLNRPELGACSLSETPHALSRRAIETIGRTALAAAPKAQAKALASGLLVETVNGVEAVRSSGADGRRAVRLHLEALRAVMAEAGPRLALVDRVRNRRAAEEGAS